MQLYVDISNVYSSIFHTSQVSIQPSVAFMSLPFGFTLSVIDLLHPFFLLAPFPSKPLISILTSFTDCGNLQDLKINFIIYFERKFSHVTFEILILNRSFYPLNCIVADMLDILFKLLPTHFFVPTLDRSYLFPCSTLIVFTSLVALVVWLLTSDSFPPLHLAHVRILRYCVLK